MKLNPKQAAGGLAIATASVVAAVGAVFTLNGPLSASAITEPTCEGTTCTVSNSSTDGVETFIVPAGITTVHVALAAAGGGGTGGTYAPGGTGGSYSFDLAVRAADVIKFHAGEPSVLSGENRHGAGGSFVFKNGSLVAAAGAGGDGSDSHGNGSKTGGAGGTFGTNQNGVAGSLKSGGGATGSGGGGQAGVFAAGENGAGTGPVTSLTSTFLNGGIGTKACDGAGNGGGGYYGGGGGGYDDGYPACDVMHAGGGGSGYLAPGVTSNPQLATATPAGTAGSVRISYAAASSSGSPSPSVSPATSQSLQSLQSLGYETNDMPADASYMIQPSNYNSTDSVVSGSSPMTNRPFTWSYPDQVWNFKKIVLDSDPSRSEWANQRQTIGSFNISLGSGKCMGLRKSTPTDRLLAPQDCASHSLSQVFSLIPLGTKNDKKTYAIMSGESGQCLTFSTTPLWMDDCGHGASPSSTNQGFWIRTPVTAGLVGNGTYHIRTLLEDRGGPLVISAHTGVLNQALFTNSEDQNSADREEYNFLITEQPNGTVKIQSKQSGKCIADVAGTDLLRGYQIIGLSDCTYQTTMRPVPKLRKSLVGNATSSSWTTPSVQTVYQLQSTVTGNCSQISWNLQAGDFLKPEECDPQNPAQYFYLTRTSSATQ